MFFRNLELVLVQLKLVETTNHWTGPTWVSDEWTFEVTVPKTPPLDCANGNIFWTCILWTFTKLSVPAEQWLPHLFLLSINFSCTADHPIHFTLEYLKTLASGEFHLRIVLLFPHMTVSWINSFLATDVRISAYGLLGS